MQEKLNKDRERRIDQEMVNRKRKERSKTRLDSLDDLPSQLGDLQIEQEKLAKEDVEKMASLGFVPDIDLALFVPFSQLKINDADY